MPAKYYFKDQSFEVFESVYPPSEDSELLATAIRIQPFSDCLDMGCGTGIAGIQMAKNGAKSITFADQNPNALKCAEQNVKINNIHCASRFIQTDLFTALPEKFDLIAFNPPYVPSDEIKWKDTDGGLNGREVLDRFINEAGKHLNPNGQIFFLQNDQNGEKKTIQMLKANGFEFELVSRQKLFFEELIVFRCWKKTTEKSSVQ